jgi:hypothetical protein
MQDDLSKFPFDVEEELINQLSQSLADSIDAEIMSQIMSMRNPRVDKINSILKKLKEKK